MEEMIKNLEELRKECIKRAEEAADAISNLEQQREHLAEMAHQIDKMAIEAYKANKNEQN